jgi:hypothetical protein
MRDSADTMYSCHWTRADFQICREVFADKAVWDNSISTDCIDMNLMDSLTALRGVSPAVKLCLLALQDLH